MTGPLTSTDVTTYYHPYTPEEPPQKKLKRSSVLTFQEFIQNCRPTLRRTQKFHNFSDFTGQHGITKEMLRSMRNSI